MYSEKTEELESSHLESYRCINDDQGQISDLREVSHAINIIRTFQKADSLVFSGVYCKCSFHISGEFMFRVVFDEGSDKCSFSALFNKKRNKKRVKKLWEKF